MLGKLLVGVAGVYIAYLSMSFFTEALYITLYAATTQTLYPWTPTCPLPGSPSQQSTSG